MMAWSEAFGCQRPVPGKGVAIADQQVREAIARQVDKFQVRVTPVQNGYVAEGLERLPIFIRSPFEISRNRSAEFNNVELPVARYIHQLLIPAADGCHRRNPANRLYRPKTRQRDLPAID